jgi:hypothetical protein
MGACLDGPRRRTHCVRAPLLTDAFLETGNTLVEAKGERVARSGPTAIVARRPRGSSKAGSLQAKRIPIANLRPPLAASRRAARFPAACTRMEGMPGHRGSPSLVSWCAAMLLTSVNAVELLASLEGLAGARSAAVSPPLVGSYLIAGIEVALTPPADEHVVRRTWRERRGRGATPLLLITDDPTRPESPLTVGPLDEGGGPHTVSGAGASRGTRAPRPGPALAKR